MPFEIFQNSHKILKKDRMENFDKNRQISNHGLSK
jgi:hypothetical protein